MRDLYRMFRRKAKEANSSAAQAVGVDNYEDIYHQGLRNGFLQAAEIIADRLGVPKAAREAANREIDNE